MHWVKLSLFHIGVSKKKHYIFRASKWKKDLEKLLKKEVFNQRYEKIGRIKDIFGPIDSPFISIKVLLDQEFNPADNLYTKLN